jgi:MFS family permease
VSGGPLALLRRVAVDARPLRYGDFRRLFIGQGVAFIGFQLTSVAVPVQMFAETGSSFWVGLIGLAALLPLVVFGLYGGAISDAVDRRLLYIVSSCVVWAATGGLLAQALLHVGNRWALLGLVAVQTVGFAVSAPVRGAIIPRILPTELVPAGNTLTFTMSTAGSVVGPLIAGVILARGSFAWAYGVDAALFTVGFYAALRLPAIPPLGEKVKPGLRAVADGLAFIATRPILLMSFVVDIAAMVLAMPRALFPEIAVDRFHDVGAVGWLYAAIAIGSVVAGLGSGWIGRVRRQGRALIVAVVAWGLAVALAGLAHRLWLAVLLLAVGGAADLVSAVYRQTILQTYAPDEMRGRLQGVFTVVVAGGPRLGDLRAGVTAAAAGATASWVGGGVACVLLVGVLAFTVPALRHYSTTSSDPRAIDLAEDDAAPG